MNDKNRNTRSTSDTDLDRKNTNSNPQRDSERDHRGNDSDLSNPVNSGNPSNVNRKRDSRELHTKDSVTGSDHDGQAD